MNERLRRILLMIPYIQKHPGIRVAELAHYLGCGTEQILADLNDVLLCGVPPYLPDDYIGVVLEEGRIYLSFAEHFSRPINLTFQEALALSLALRRLPLSRSKAAVADGLRKKIMDLLPRGTRPLWREARRRFKVSDTPKDIEERIALLEQAIEERRSVRMEYYAASRDAMTQREVRPYGLVELDGEWYLVGHCLLRDRELPFRVDRIRTLQLTDQRFEVPASFDIRAYRRAQMYFPTSRDYRVKLRVAPELAGWLREEQPIGRTRKLPDGSLLLQLSVSQPQWVISWVMSHAGKVELLAPEALRRKLAEACRKAAEPYLAPGRSASLPEATGSSSPGR